MARMDTTGLDELIRDMQRLGESSGPMAEAMVDAASVEIKNAWRESAERYGLRDTGAMIESIGSPGGTKRLGDTLYRDIYPQGRDGKGVRNAEKAFIHNYGTSSIRPTYWVDDAEAKAAPRVEAKLTDMWDEYLKTGQIPTVTDPSSTGEGMSTHRTGGR